MSIWIDIMWDFTLFTIEKSLQYTVQKQKRKTVDGTMVKTINYLVSAFMYPIVDKNSGDLIDTWMMMSMSNFT